MPLKKYFSSKHSALSNTSEFDKLKRNQKSEMRMISPAALKFSYKFVRVENTIHWQGETEACNVRMYETHFPGFCYLKDGKQRKVANVTNAINVDPNESSEKIRSLLFKDAELDIRKVLCLHLLGTHVQKSRHIQRKDGRFCSFVKSQYQCSRFQTVKSSAPKENTNEKDVSSVYDKILPRYILEVRSIGRFFSNLSLQTSDTDICSDDEIVKKTRMQVPIYINNDIRAIVTSIIEALEMVNSPKLKNLINLAASPEELRNLLAQEEIQEFVKQLASNELVTRATAYDLVLTHPVFDKIPETGTMETIAQILEITVDSELRYLIQLTRKMIFHRHEQLVECSLLQGKKNRAENSKGNTLRNRSKTSSISDERSTKMFCPGNDIRFSRCLAESSEKMKAEKFSHSDDFSFPFTPSKDGKSKKISSQSIKKTSPSHSERIKTFLPLHEKQQNQENSPYNTSGLETRIESKFQSKRFEENDITKCELKNLSNSQRILLGLKVANMKSKPVNMHQFERNRNIDIPSLISSIVRPEVSDSDFSKVCTEDTTYSLDQKRQRSEMMSGINRNQVQVLENLTKKMLFNFRHEISTAENKRRVREFMNKQL